MIPDADRQNFNTLYSAFQSGNLALLEARRKSDGKQVSLIVAVHHDKEQTFVICPKVGQYVPWIVCSKCEHGNIDEGDYDFVGCSYQEEPER